MKSAKLRFPLLMALLILVTVALAGCGGSDAPVAETAAPAAAQEAVQETALDLPLNINAAQTNEIRSRDDVVILDVREDWEFTEGHIPGAAWIPLGQLSSRLSEIPTDKTVVVACRSGNRSDQATAFLRGQGFTNVHNMTGGMITWEQAGFDIEK